MGKFISKIHFTKRMVDYCLIDKKKIKKGRLEFNLPFSKTTN